MELNKAMLDCMQQLKRKLRAEQNLVIRLSDADVITQMLAACLKSNDEETRQLGRQLAEYSVLWQHPNHVESASPAAAPAATPSNDGRVRIYRGQRVYG